MIHNFGVQAVELANVYERQTRGSKLGSTDAGEAAKADDCKAIDAQKAALLAARMALKDSALVFSAVSAF